MPECVNLRVEKLVRKILTAFPLPRRPIQYFHTCFRLSSLSTSFLGSVPACNGCMWPANDNNNMVNTLCMIWDNNNMVNYVYLMNFDVESGICCPQSFFEPPIESYRRYDLYIWEYVVSMMMCANLQLYIMCKWKDLLTCDRDLLEPWSWDPLIQLVWNLDWMILETCLMI